MCSLSGYISHHGVDGRTCSRHDRHGLCQLSHIGASQLITEGSMRPMEGKLTDVGLLSSDNIGAVLLLPQLENTLQCALEDLQRCSTQSSRGMSPMCSLKVTEGSSDSGVTVGSSDETVVALRQLLALVRYSRHVRLAITNASPQSDVSCETDSIVPLLVCSNFRLMLL